MQLIADGKTKTLYAYRDGQVMIVFKDDVTGSEEGIDPGGNEVVGQLAGKGRAALSQSVYFFELLENHGVPTHFISADFERGAIIAHEAKWFGLEFVIRFRAFGSFVRRYGKFVEEGAPLHGLVEITIKDDQRGDPLIVDEALVALGIMTGEQVAEAKSLVKRAAEVIRNDLASRGLELLDMKFECGVVGDRLVIIDDISTDNMRVVRDGEKVTPQMLSQALSTEIRE